MKRGLCTVLLAAVLFLLAVAFVQSQMPARPQARQIPKPPPNQSTEVDLGEINY